MDTRRTALPQGAGRTGGRRKVDDSHLASKGICTSLGQRSTWRCQSRVKGGLGKAVPIAHRPGFAVNRQVGRPLPHELATQVRPVNVQFAQVDGLQGQIGHDRFCHARLLERWQTSRRPPVPARCPDHAAHAACTRRSVGVCSCVRGASGHLRWRCAAPWRPCGAAWALAIGRQLDILCPHLLGSPPDSRWTPGSSPPTGVVSSQRFDGLQCLQHRTSACSRVAGSSQSRSSAAFRLEPPTSECVPPRQRCPPAPAPAGAQSRPVPCAGRGPEDCTCLRPGWLPTVGCYPGLPATGANRRSASAPPVQWCARSAADPAAAAIRRWRKPTRVPLLKGGSVQSRQSRTSCQRRSIVVASITSSSEAPVYAWRMVARASWAGGMGGWPRRAVLVERRQFRLKRLRKEFMALLAQKDKQLGASNPFDDRLFCWGGFNRWMPQCWTHVRLPHVLKMARSKPYAQPTVNHSS